MDNKKRSQKSQTSDKVCRVCGTPLATSKEAIGPFCSERCRLQDLSKWFGENYRIASTPAQVPGEEESE